jgi:hypothetical protein
LDGFHVGTPDDAIDQRASIWETKGLDWSRARYQDVELDHSSQATEVEDVHLEAKNGRQM